eukprot:775320-Lingulodinium_polyedra.AAC.1
MKADFPVAASAFAGRWQELVRRAAEVDVKLRLRSRASTGGRGRPEGVGTSVAKLAIVAMSEGARGRGWSSPDFGQRWSS